MDPRSYHLGELDVALSSRHPDRLMPQIPKDCRRVLDIGCGAAQTLIAANLQGGAVACGLDIDLEALRLGRELSPRTNFICGIGERLPFQSGYFDIIISRVALPYMNIPDALQEIARVLRPSGTLWLALHPPSFVWRELGNSVKELRLKDVLYRLYVVSNGITLHLTGRNFRFPLGHRRCESFQTRDGMERLLLAHGFENISISIDAHFVVSATKRVASSSARGRQTNSAEARDRMDPAVRAR